MVCSYSEQRNLLMLISLYDQKIPELDEAQLSSQRLVHAQWLHPEWQAAITH